MPLEREQIGACTLYRGDCYALLDALPRVALCTDPPYGIGYVARHKRLGKQREYATPYDGKALQGDEALFDPRPWLAFPASILWGANHFCTALPHTGRWLVWDKRGGGFHGINSFADCEIAWCSRPGPARIHLQIWNGIVRQGEPAGQGEHRMHPTQKPLALMAWCLSFITGQPILDPFMGSGTTGVACVQLGRSFVGVEIDERYFQLACARITAAYAQPDLFVPTPPRPTQQPLFAAGGG